MNSYLRIEESMDERLLKNKISSRKYIRERIEGNFASRIKFLFPISKRLYKFA